VPLDKALLDRIRANIPSITRNPSGTETLTVNNIITTPTLPTSMVAHRTPLVCCQGRNDTQQNFEILVIIGQCYDLKISISALIDSGRLQTNIINGRVAQLLLKNGNATIRQASRSLGSGVGGGIFEVNSLIDFDIRFFKPDGVEEVHSICIRALISPDIRTDLIIGLPTIKKYNLLN
jgi:hypothetical protein